MTSKDIRQKLKLSLSSRILSIAEQLPTAERGPLANLQDIQRRRREEAQRDYSRNRPPEGVGLTYSSIRLFEVFNREREGDMERDLRRLFTGVEDSQESLDEHLHNERDLSGGGWSYVGTLARQGGQTMYMPRFT
jgi:hypothetical protein